ncbi:MAG: glycosyltransferase [Geopsychrobacter sp.]|nr:glycosyltransferase [Geopsychrobacter sp.]
MHVVQVCKGVVPPVNYGGIERIVFWLTRELLQRGVRVTVIAHPESEVATKLAGVAFVPYLFEQDDYRQLIPPDADIVHLHDYPPEGREPAIPYLVTEHGNRNRGKFLANTVFVSRNHAENHHSQHFVYNGIPVSEYPFYRDKDDFMLFLAKLDWRVKNVKTALRLAFDLDFPLALAGGDLWASIKKTRGTWLLKYPFKKQLIRHEGQVFGAKKLELLQKAKLLFYLANWAEPFGLAPHEALACGTPVLVTPNGAFPEYVKSGVNGYVVRSYAEALESVRSLRGMSATEYEQMSEACRDSAFTSQEMTHGYLAYYERILKGEMLSGNADELRFSRPKSIRVTPSLF